MQILRYAQDDVLLERTLRIGHRDVADLAKGGFNSFPSGGELSF